MRIFYFSTLVLALSLVSSLRGADDAAPNSADNNPERIPTIKEIMQEAHRCRTNYISLVRRGLRQDEIPWDEVGQKSRDLVRMGRYLQQNAPPKGTRQDWEKITNIYISHATLLADAADRYDKDTAVLHQSKMQAMCATCHRAHR